MRSSSSRMASQPTQVRPTVKGAGEPNVSADPAIRREIPDATVARLPGYLRALTDVAERGISSVSSEELATAAGVRSTQLRKDLSHLGSYGVRGVGYEVEHLALEISRALGLTQDWPVAIVGMGNLGRALAAYSGFAIGGFHVAALFDEDPSLAGEHVGDVPVSPMTELALLAEAEGLSLGVIATPAASALNFAPVVLVVPPGVNVRRVDLATELHVLAFHEQQKSLDADLGLAQ